MKIGTSIQGFSLVRIDHWELHGPQIDVIIGNMYPKPSQIERFRLVGESGHRVCARTLSGGQCQSNQSGGIDVPMDWAIKKKHAYIIIFFNNGILTVINLNAKFQIRRLLVGVWSSYSTSK